jgi:galactokinase/mevalonate kinase-like predicted kinase
MAEALRAADLARVGALLSENWRLQQQLDRGMTTERMGRLEREREVVGILGGKAAGAGAGGSMFWFSTDFRETRRGSSGRNRRHPGSRRPCA